MAHTAWNKGYTKADHPSVHKISETMRRKRIDNFAEWRARLPAAASVGAESPGDLAELIGVTLGDGYIGQHARTQVLRIVSNSNNPGFVARYAKLVEMVFQKKPAVKKRRNANCIDIVLYKKEIAHRLGLKTGAKMHRVFILPQWLQESRECKIRLLRGLHESDGCFAIHEPTHTYKFIFSNANQSLLDTVFVIFCELGFHPTKTKRKIQLSRKQEVFRAVELLRFRMY